MGFSLPVFRNKTGYLGSLNIRGLAIWGPGNEQAFGNTAFHETCPVTVLTPEALSKIPLPPFHRPVPSDYMFPYPGQQLTPKTIDYIQLCKSLVRDLVSNQPYILGGEIEWGPTVNQSSTIDLTCIAARPCKETSEYLVAVARCACPSLEMLVTLTNVGIQFKLGYIFFLGYNYVDFILDIGIFKLYSLPITILMGTPWDQRECNKANK